MSDHQQQQKWLDLRTGAEYLGLNERTLRNYIKSGTLPAYRLGPRQIRIKQTDLDALLHSIPAGSDL